MRRKDFSLFVILFSIMAVITGTWIVKLVNGYVLYVDQWTRELVSELAGSYVFTIFRWITELGSGTFLTPFTIIMSIVLWRLYHDWLVAVIFGLGTLSSHGLNVLIKILVERDRPSIFAAADAEGYSFPSGHAMMSTVCYGLLSYFLAKKIENNTASAIMYVGFLLLIFLIGISRYIINVHYLTDVLGGFFFGSLCLCALVLIYKAVQKKRSGSPS
ncbi:phosphatase PAP2 family protein [Virgibacillus ihumii]|uniref:phosphatase PAP2 family protein n=1 Tax=Virgibacillus ihumii TaxID=2686091 RepID=UPI001FE4ACCD|nr:phosphatase PAP2 family protein [Virgibacillus ihumii]